MKTNFCLTKSALRTIACAMLTIALASLFATASTATPTLNPTAVVVAASIPDVGGPSPTMTPEVVVETVVTGLEAPWALAFAPDGRIFVTERPGRIRVIIDGVLLTEPLATVEVLHEFGAEAGLLGIAVDPEFESNHYVYVYHTYADDLATWNRVLRLTEVGDEGRDLTVILDRIPGSWVHNGGRIKFGPDGKLYITTGDAGRPELAQDVNHLPGKVLRINPDGSIPEDNPIPNSPVFTYGHRNPQGLAWHPISGEAYITEHGPAGRDEVNILRPGGNYGWPLAVGIALDARFVNPVFAFPEPTPPSGATFYTGKSLPAQWQNNFFFATLGLYTGSGRAIYRLELDPDKYSTVRSAEPLFSNEYGRLRDIVEGPDGSLYFLTSNRDGRGQPSPDDDRLLKVVPHMRPEPINTNGG